MVIRAVLLDRDGTINVKRADHVKSVAEFEFLPDALAGIALLARLPVSIFVVSNQACVGRGIITAKTLWEITGHMCARINGAGGRIDAVFYCTHTPEYGCACRKPGTALLERAAQMVGCHPHECVMAGDAGTDMLAAEKFGAIPFLVGNGNTIAGLARLLQAGLT